MWKEIATYLYATLGQPRCVLDPAGGRGEFINAIPAPERWLVDAVDQIDYVDSDVKQIVADIFDVDLPDHHFDGVFVSNFLEHLATQESVASLLVRLHKAMVPGGTIAIMGPNFKVCPGIYFDCADHVLALTEVAVTEHLYAAGFEIKTVHRRFLPYSFRSLLPASPRLTRAYLHTPMAWRLVGAQFLVIATADSTVR